MKFRRRNNYKINSFDHCHPTIGVIISSLYMCYEKRQGIMSFLNNNRIFLSIVLILLTDEIIHEVSDSSTSFSSNFYELFKFQERTTKVENDTLQLTGEVERLLYQYRCTLSSLNESCSHNNYSDDCCCLSQLTYSQCNTKVVRLQASIGTTITTNSTQHLEFIQSVYLNTRQLDDAWFDNNNNKFKKYEVVYWNNRFYYGDIHPFLNVLFGCNKYGPFRIYPGYSIRLILFLVCLWAYGYIF